MSRRRTVDERKAWQRSRLPLNDDRGSRIRSTVPGIVHDALSSSGQPLDSEARALLEPRFGHDFSKVRVHADRQGGASARAVQALAYTVGNDVVFAPGQHAPHTRAGRKLIAHELAHGVTQNRGGEFSLQRQTSGSGEAKAEEKKEAGEVIAEGLKTAGEQAVDNNPKVKEQIIDPLKGTLEKKWDSLPTGEKVIVGGFGAATVGLGAGPLLADPNGRKVLEGINLAAPLQLIPYVPLSSFKYTLPSGDSAEKRQFRFDTTFNIDDILKLHGEHTGLPPITFELGMQWGYDPTTERLSVLGAQAQLGLVPGFKISGGAYPDLLPMPQVYFNSDGGRVESRQTIPELPKTAPQPDVRVMLTVDLLKFSPSTLGKQIQGIFGHF